MDSFFIEKVNLADKYIKFKNNLIINDYLANLLKKNISIKEDFFFFNKLQELESEENPFKKKQISIDLAESSLIKVGLFPLSIKNKLNNLSYYKNISHIGYNNLVSQIKNQIVYSAIIEELELVIFKLNIISIDMFQKECVEDLISEYKITKNPFIKEKLNQLNIIIKNH